MADGEERVYVIRFKQGRVNHACLPRFASLGFFQLDQMFGGGFHTLCGKSCEGDAAVSEELKKLATWVTCKACRTHIGLEPKTDTGKVPWKGTKKSFVR